METTDKRKRRIEDDAALAELRRKLAGYDDVDHPAHYTHSRIEVWDAIDAWGLNYFLGNVVKYVARADRKGNAVQDLQKAAAYIAKEIERRRAASATRSGYGYASVVLDEIQDWPLDEHGRFQTNLPPSVRREQ